MLKWNDHHSLFFVGAEELCESEEYTDVTLAAGTKFFAAHKLILSICSPYFRQLFRSMGREKTVIYLKDVNPRHLDLLLQYMYKGEIKVKESELVSVLQVAQGLDIKGLSEQGGSVSGAQNQTHPRHNQPLEERDPQIKPSMKRVYPEDNSTRENTVDPIRKKPKTPVPTEEIPPMMPLPSPSSNITPEIARVEVKRELTPVTIDLDGSDQGGSMSGFEGLSQEMAFIDTSVSTGFEGEVSYEDGQYYEEAMGHVSVTDERAGRYRVPAPPLLLGAARRPLPNIPDVASFCFSCKDVFDRRANPLPCFDCNLWFHNKCRGKHNCDTIKTEKR